jgi:hypothetical protein
MRHGATVVQGGGARMQNPFVRRRQYIQPGAKFLSGIVQVRDAGRHELARPCMATVSGVASMALETWKRRTA